MLNYQLWRLFGPTSWPIWLVLLATATLLLPRLRHVTRLPLALGTVVVLLLALTPAGIWLIRPLEDRFPIPDLRVGDLPDLAQAGRLHTPVNDIIVLTGPEETSYSARSGRAEYGPGADRVIEGAVLKHQFPAANLWVIGGVRNRHYPRYDWQWTLDTWSRLGIQANGIGATTDTWHNAWGAKRAGIGGRPLLVTSAWHMPRAMAAFRAAGLNPIAYPVDYQTGPNKFRKDDWQLAPANNLARADLALHEWVGLAFYYVTGRIGEFWPH